MKKLVKTHDELIEYMHLKYPEDGQLEIRIALDDAYDFLTGEFDREEVRKKEIAKEIYHMSVAVSGRIGYSNTILISEANDKKYNLSELFKKHDKLKESDIVFGDVDDIYIYRKCKIDQPGLVLLYTEDKYYIADIGFYPHRQFMKVQL